MAEASVTPDAFQLAAEEFEGKPIPEVEFLANFVERLLDVPIQVSQYLAKVYLQNLQYLGGAVPSHTTNGRLVPGTVRTDAKKQLVEPKVGRQFLETCFVLMPFAGMRGTYFKEIYAPAMREAQFEPVRADDLFASGSVIEQIAEQISHSTVLLAELSGRNPNVFYELGIAHAWSKPVVLLTNNIEDVPFDLRHLRVITYNVEEPKWAEKLGAEITSFLQNARAEPKKSIPAPFRDHIEVSPKAVRSTKGPSAPVPR